LRACVREMTCALCARYHSYYGTGFIAGKMICYAIAWVYLVRVCGCSARGDRLYAVICTAIRTPPQCWRLLEFVSPRDDVDIAVDYPMQSDARKTSSASSTDVKATTSAMHATASSGSVSSATMDASQTPPLET
jgi:hypothetical protein